MLTMEQIQSRAPSVFATTPWNQVSENYRFVPTMDVLDAMIAKGFQVVTAGQAKTRIEGKGDFTRHVVHLRHSDFMKEDGRGGEFVPELVLMNSHDRSSAYKLMLGMFRFVCSNGMIVCSSMLDEITARHSGSADLVQEVIDGSFRIIDAAPKVAKQIQRWQNIELTGGKDIAYAEAVLELSDRTVKPTASELLCSRRGADDGRNLWLTMNRVQENMIKGGLRPAPRDVGSRRRVARITRPINSVNEDVKFNRALWRLTEEMAKVA